MTRSAQGEDRSNFQAIGPWKNLDFGWCKATEGLTFTDRTFSANWANLGQQVAYRGAYHFFHPGLDPHAQAGLFIRAVTQHGLRPGDMLAIDAEIAAGAAGAQVLAPTAYRRSEYFYADDKGRARIHPDVTDSLPRRTFRRDMPPKLTASLVGSGALEFLTAVKLLARQAVGGDYCPVFCYSFTSFLPQLAPCTAYPLWVASFSRSAPRSVSPWTVWDIWQYAGGGGQFGSDQDAFNGTRDAMDTWMRAYQPGAKPQPEPKPAPNWTETLMQQLPTVQAGAAGQDVRTIQGLLCARGHAIVIDGAFGNATKTAIQQVQAAKGLTADGIVGPSTWPALLNR